MVQRALGRSQKDDYQVPMAQSRTAKISHHPCRLVLRVQLISSPSYLRPESVIPGGSGCGFSWTKEPGGERPGGRG